ncbi:MAG: orotidine-5'-phosphate decarboxylase [Treponema sp.]|jgi:orotidine-5'-phosphate decarboxylase|nr:orotidine-5'-phosphate decarboxylase [Treponema sp.]
MDRLYEAVADRGHVCVGLDTAVEYIPEKERLSSNAESVLAYNKAIIDAVIDITACFKVQIAYYEEMGIQGLQTYMATLKYLRGKNALVIADIKRGDIADTASRYARAHFEGDFEADFVTLTPFLGMDSIEPWLQWADKKGKGAFVLMRTSNKGRRDFQDQEVNTDTLNKPGRARLCDLVGSKLSSLAVAYPGKYGYGMFGAVVGVDPQTKDEREEALAIRAGYSNLFFLIPGYGAQGGAATDAALLLQKGNGGVVNASRSILKAWQNTDGDLAKADNAFAANAARKAVIEMREALLTAANSRRGQEPRFPSAKLS